VAASRYGPKGRAGTVDGYGLYVDGISVACSAEGRIGYRMWAMRTGRINPSLEYRYDHDVDELLV
jgi:hypothetical protein